MAAMPAPPAASPSPQPPAAPAPAQIQPQPPLPGPSNDLDSKARRLADFFNGEVVAFEGSLDDDEPHSDAAA